MRAQGIPESPARVEYTVQFSRGPKGRRRTREASKHPAAAPHVPKITRLLILGHHFERLVRDGVVKDYAEIARLTGLTRARVTQIVNLTLLAPEIQDNILNRQNPARDLDLVTERALRELTSHVDWRKQQVLWLESGH